MQFNFVRRLDDLGRIVIPKEIRNKLNFNYGDLLDLSMNSEALIIKKTSSIFNKEYIGKIIDLVEYLSNYDIILCDTEKIIEKSSNISININDIISDDLKALINEHKSEKFNEGVKITNNYFLNNKVYVKALIKDSNTVGLLILRTHNQEDINLFLSIITKLLLQ